MRALSLLSLYAVVLTLGLGGCGGFQTEKEVAAPSSSKVTDSKAAPEPPAAPTVPEALQNDAYAYMGLGRKEPLTYVSTGAPAGDGEVTETIDLTSIEGGTAKFTIHRTGVLDQFGAETLTLDEKGLTLVSLEKATLNGPALNFPAKVEMGKAWQSVVDVSTSDGRTAKVALTMRPVREEQVKTKAGEFDALLVTGEGSIVSGAIKAKATVKQWMVKGIGAVKQEYVQTPEGGKPTKLALEIVKQP